MIRPKTAVTACIAGYIVREARNRALPSATRSIESKLKDLQNSLPPGYQFQIGGEKAKEDDGFLNLAVVLLISLVGIYLALLVQFKNAVKPLLKFAVAPYGAIGALIALAIMGTPFGFMAFLGFAGRFLNFDGSVAGYFVVVDGGKEIFAISLTPGNSVIGVFRKTPLLAACPCTRSTPTQGCNVHRVTGGHRFLCHSVTGATLPDGQVVPGFCSRQRPVDRVAGLVRKIPQLREMRESQSNCRPSASSLA